MRLTGLEGITAVVTGAAGGIGARVVEYLAAEGAAVAAVDTAPVAKEDAFGSRVTHHTADVADATAAEWILDQVEADHGPVGVLVNVAGVLHTGPLLSLTDQAWQEMLTANATGVLTWSRAVVRRMTPHHRGCVITVASNSAGTPRAGMAAYAASKAAASALTLGLGLEVARLGIRCNVVCPGSTDTAMLHRMAPTPEAMDAVVHGDPAAFRVGIPLGRVADPGDVAAAVVFLASEQARHITLHSLYVDGGAALHG
ncbi:SDR family NAD(P)-dependent oxidoreductase [Streptomyces sp. H27-S2]|uniref:SDR family NAD(P)-dependent oxidoreductase n=1 Tax=Streptomyces antarcticus TaxID=2996458 RepID=UPI002270CF8F|nr:SDR family NAD(P)-dependent oxidoreductase [Streptomyces sp. H27-S2]MCY0950469.1 SDR family oxidoreductase [Streptomyces sp. H27-S2]